MLILDHALEDRLRVLHRYLYVDGERCTVASLRTQLESFSNVVSKVLRPSRSSSQSTLLESLQLLRSYRTTTALGKVD